METKNASTNLRVMGSICLLILSVGRLLSFYSSQDKTDKSAVLWQQVGTRVRHEKDNAEIVIDSLVKAKGHIFLYTNDTLAKAAWVPNIPPSHMPIDPLLGGVSFDIEESRHYQEFLENQDSLGFELQLYNDYYGGFTYPLNGNIVLEDGAATKRLYFMGQDSKGKISYESREKLYADSALLKSYPSTWERNFVTTWGVGIDDVSDLTAESLHNAFFSVSTRLMKKIDGFHFYMAGVEKDNHHPGMDSISFIRSVEVARRSLQKLGIDTKGFQVKVFSGLN